MRSRPSEPCGRVANAHPSAKPNLGVVLRLIVVTHVDLAGTDVQIVRAPTNELRGMVLVAAGEPGRFHPAVGELLARLEDRAWP